MNFLNNCQKLVKSGNKIFLCCPISSIALLCSKYFAWNCRFQLQPSLFIDANSSFKFYWKFIMDPKFYWKSIMNLKNLGNIRTISKLFWERAWYSYLLLETVKDWISKFSGAAQFCLHSLFHSNYCVCNFRFQGCPGGRSK